MFVSIFFFFSAQRLQRDPAACPTETDKRRLRATEQSFANRWRNLSRNTARLQRLTEERLVLCREFWNDYRTFVEWLNETETALEAAGKATEMPRTTLKRFEVSGSFTDIKCIVFWFLLVNEGVVVIAWLSSRWYNRT